MDHGRAEALLRRLLQIAKNAVDAGCVNPGIAFRDRVRALPALLVLDEPGALLR